MILSVKFNLEGDISWVEEVHGLRIIYYVPAWLLTISVCPWTN